MKTLYTFNWAGGGWNQVYAITLDEARILAKNLGVKYGLQPLLGTLRKVHDEDAYYRQTAALCD
jgi:hypothetical protein